MKRGKSGRERGEMSELGAASGVLARAREAYADTNWQRAFELLSLAAQEDALTHDDRERLAWSAFLIGRDDDALHILQELYEDVASDVCLRAARAAFWIGFRLFGIGEQGRAMGWLGRAQRLVEREGDDCALAGWLMLPLIARHLGSGDHARARETAAAAAERGERFADADLVAFARNLEGRALLRDGKTTEGLALLDEVMLAVTSGELSPLVTGLTYCSVIATCQQVYAVDRAREWTAALSSWCSAQPELFTFTGACMIHRAEILQLGGDWPRAIEEVERARQRLSSSDADSLADSYYQQAEIHRLCGELDAAEAAYRQSSELGGDPQPGLALLRLAQGRGDEASAAIRRATTTTSEAWRRGRFLPACVEIMLATGNLEEARAACRDLEEMAASFDTEIVRAMAAQARGALCLAEGDARAAIEPLRRAYAVWRKIGAPYIAARIRVLIGNACERLGDRDGARLELECAARVFEELGATPDLTALRSQDKAGASARPAGLTRREFEVLRLLASGKTNKAIATELFVSERTIDRHVSNIFRKLEVSTRAAATAFAYEHGLV